MGKKILVIPASNSSQSINKAFANYVASLIEDAEIKTLNLNDFEMPLYSFDREEELGVPELAKKFIAEIEAADQLIVSLAEHNGSYAAAFKNIIDWASRHKKDFWSAKKMLLLSTSPGGRGAVTIMEAAKGLFPRLGAEVVATFSLPLFYENFKEGEGVINLELRGELLNIVSNFS